MVPSIMVQATVSAAREVSRQSVLVTGGAGYIGAHCARRLLEHGYRVLVVDDLSTGHRWAVPTDAQLVEADSGDIVAMGEVIRTHEVSAVMHFAARTVVPESVAHPLEYYANNACGTRALISACMQHGVSRFVFSSTAAVYGAPKNPMVSETAPTFPINPYGRSKLAAEWILRDVAAATQEVSARAPFRYIALRYFNVAGGREDGTLGQSTPHASHLIKVAAQAACGLRTTVPVFGTDFDTPDGTGVRDYIHVEDLADAHLAALLHLDAGGASAVYNCGYGRGYSVLEVLDAMRRTSGVDLQAEIAPRRVGDPPAIVADASLIRRDLDWKPLRDDLDLICSTAFRWEQHLLQQHG